MTCKSFTGWADEEIIFCDREVGPDGTHDGMHAYPVSTKYKEDHMSLEERFKKAVEGLEAGLGDLKLIVADMEKAVAIAENGEKKRGKKAATPPADDGLGSGTTGSKAIKVEDVTIEMLRAMATKYSEVFGMEKLLALNTKHGGAKKLSGIDPKMYGVVYGAMTDDLAAAEALKSNAEKPLTNGDLKAKAETLAKEIGPISIEKVREHAAAFLAKNGEPAFRAVLKAFGAEKLSGVPEDKRGAFLEAIDNA